MSTEQLPERLRAACAAVRSKSLPLSDLTPLMQQAADAIAAYSARREGGAVAEVCDTFQLRWVGSGPIAPIVRRHGIKVGTKLYTHPATDASQAEQAPLIYGWLTEDGSVKRNPDVRIEAPATVEWAMALYIGQASEAGAVEALRAWKRAEEYGAQYGHLTEARDDITEGWEMAVKMRDDALSAAPHPAGADNGGKTGWPPGLLQDDSRGLAQWFASRPDARRRVREALGAAPAPHQSAAQPADGHIDLAHELWAAAQLTPGEGIADGAERIAGILAAQQGEEVHPDTERLDWLLRNLDAGPDLVQRIGCAYDEPQEIGREFIDAARAAQAPATQKENP